MRRLNHSELYAISDKDDKYYNDWCNIQHLAQRILGTRRWLQYRSAITFVTRFGYFAIGNPTLGEEFCQASSERNYANILLKNEYNWPINVRPFIKLLKDIHLITFYLFGDFYELSDRITGSSHSTEQSLPAANYGNLNKLIGLCSMLKLLIDLPKEVVTTEFSTEPGSSVRTERKTSAMCQLCSSPRQEPTSAICGHVFCWYCIHKWLKERSECPICRTPTEPSRLIHLINYK